MAVNGLAGFHGSAVHPTRVLRNLAATLLGQPSVSHANSASATTRGGCYGVVAGGDLAVTPTTALGFSIAAGRLAGPGTTALAQGGYVGYNDAAVVSAVGARNATNPRIDYVAWRVRDTDEDASGAEDDGLIVIAGTAAASPTPPTLSAGQGTLVILAEILVPSTANGGPIAITDRRAYLSAIGGIQRCTSTTRPTGAALWKGLFAFELDTGAILWYDGSAWRYQYKPETSYTPTPSGFTATGGTFGAGYTIIDNQVRYTGRFTVGPGSNLNGGIGLTLPVAASGLLTRRPGMATLYDASAGQMFSAQSLINPGSSTTTMEVDNVQGATNTIFVSNTVPFGWAVGDEFWWDITYPAA